MQSYRIHLIIVLFLACSAAVGQPIGTVESDGWYSVQGGAGKAVERFNRSEYTAFSGDTITSQTESTVLNLTGGGGLGIPRDSSISITRGDQGNLTVELVAGAVLYAFPASDTSFAFHAGNFKVSGQSPEARSIPVNVRPASVGTIELLAGGNIKATVRSGELFVQNGGGVRYRVSAGESVGILDLPATTVLTQSASPATSPLILIQSPERVGTGEEFQVLWESQQAVRGDYIAIAKSGAEPNEFVTVVSSDEGQILDLTAPSTPGDYEIRFIDGETGAVHKFVYLDVVQDIVPVYWWNENVLGAALAVAAGGTAIYIVAEEGGSNRPRPVSP